MKRDIFRRGVRMNIPFGATEKLLDPLDRSTWEPQWPRAVSDLSRPRGSMEVSQYGEHAYRQQSSPIQKPSGRMASINGPAPDVAQEVSMPVPVGTKRRLGPLKTDK
jgi:hypothetical protein